MHTHGRGRSILSTAARALLLSRCRPSDCPNHQLLPTVFVTQWNSRTWQRASSSTEACLLTAHSSSRTSKRWRTIGTPKTSLIAITRIWILRARASLSSTSSSSSIRGLCSARGKAPVPEDRQTWLRSILCYLLLAIIWRRLQGHAGFAWLVLSRVMASVLMTQSSSALSIWNLTG